MLMLLAIYLLGLILDSEYVGSIFLRNVDKLLLGCIPDDSTIHSYRCKNLKSIIFFLHYFKQRQF
jgi:hypothetical protein